MKKFWLILGLALILVALGGAGYRGFGTGPAFGQYYYPYPQPPFLSCNPSDPYCYYDYYSVPYADPYSQYFYYTVPKVGEGYEERRERWEHREHRGYEERERRGREH